MYGALALPLRQGAVLRGMTMMDILTETQHHVVIAPASLDVWQN